MTLFVRNSVQKAGELNVPPSVREEYGQHRTFKQIVFDVI